MPISAIPAFDPTHGRAIHSIAESSVIQSSVALPWRGFIVEQYAHPPMEMVEMVLPGHHLTLQLSAPLTIERKIAGTFQMKRTLPGSLTLTSSYMPLQARWREPVAILAIALEPSFVAQVAQEPTPTRMLEFKPQFGRIDPQVERIGRTLLAELEADAPNDPLFAESLVTALTLHLLRHYLAIPWRPERNMQGFSPVVLREITEYLGAHLSEAISLQDLATLVGFSPSRFSTLFRAATGQSPYQYVLALRVERAKTLLRHSQLPLGVIARQAGFANQSHMTRHVQRVLGVTPMEIRRSQW